MRINHMRNCFLCHAASMDKNDLVRGAVPRPGLPLPRLYYVAERGDFVQANITFLWQDFSVAQHVDDAGPWPEMQRFDYLVRTRLATKAEMADLKNASTEDYPQRRAVLTTLRSLTGSDLGASTAAWQQYAEKLSTDKAAAPKGASGSGPLPVAAR
jgi:hypothetical protein